jgi:Cdc6-like AAA superfamily ATPase
MILTSQAESLQQLNNLASNDKHSIMIEGITGSGKTYLAKQYSKMLNIDDFQIIEPKVQTIKDAINNCYQTGTSIVLCIENLDLGLPVASYSILKFLEEPLSSVYIVVTCRNIKQVPDTIISRSAVVSVAPPTAIDLISYADSIDSNKYKYMAQYTIFQCARTLNDIHMILDMNKSQIDYYHKLNDIFDSKDSISNLCWKLQKYEDDTPTPVDLVIRYIMESSKTYSNNPRYIWNIGHECLKELARGRISTNAILAKLLFEIKYGG